MHRHRFAILVAFLSVGGIARAQDALPAADSAPTAGAAVPDGAAPQEGAGEVDPAQAEAEAQMAAFEASLQFQTGTIRLRDGLASVRLGEGYRYLGPEDTGRVLEAWGNPPGPPTLGMLFPPNSGVFSDGGFAVVLTYVEDGHVDDDDAGDIDYDELLGQMQAATNEENAQRTSQGFEAVTLVGWAEPPHYDARTHKFFWAKRLRFGEAETLNYAVRVLGRIGVLELNAIAPMTELASVRGAMPQVMSFVDFEAGHRYADFDESTDRVAEYGLAALVAGGLATKTGFFKGLLMALLAMKKALVAVVVAIGAGLRALFQKLRGGGPAPADTQGDDTSV